MKVTKFRGNPQYMTAKTVDPGDYNIENAEERDVNGEKQLVLLIAGQDRDLRLNPHQVNKLARAFGEDTDLWVGKPITISKGDKKGLSVEPKTDGTAAPKGNDK